MPKILMRGALFLLVVLAASQIVYSRIMPKEASRLNYRTVGFSFEPEAHYGMYTLEIAQGSFSSADSFRQNIVRSYTTGENRIIREVPSFGKSYTWRVSWVDKKNTPRSGPLHHFSTYIAPNADTSKFRLKILHAAERFSDHYVSVDEGAVLYNMNGEPVWFLPDTNGFGSYVADMKFTSEGTVTFIYKKPYEINFNGDILWKVTKNGVVSGDTLGEFFHHEFCRLSNGHYMALGSQLMLCKTVTDGDSSRIVVSPEYSKVEKDGYKFGIFGTLIEYDQNGNVVWSWKSSGHLIGTDFDYYKSEESNLRYQPHDNAFYFDEKNNFIYIGFRNISRIMKIDYPAGNLLATYGDCFKPGCRGVGEGLFCGQHSIGRSKDGNLYVFSNNSCRRSDSLPSVIEWDDHISPDGKVRKVWEYVCDVEPKVPKKFNSGGNAIELADGSFFINLGSEYSKLSIVTREKEVLWSAVPERFVETDRIWIPIHQYRSNIISHAELEKLVWRAEAYLEPGE